VADIFISYARTDRLRIQPLVAALEASGWSVWWDLRIEVGDPWDKVIEAAIGKAKCVVVVWSKASIQSEWVRTEATEAKRRNILVPIRIDDVDLPLAFRHLQVADLIIWKGDKVHEGYESVVRSVAGLVARATIPPPSHSSPPKRRFRIVLRWSLVIASALIAALGLQWWLGSSRAQPGNPTAQTQAASQPSLTSYLPTFFTLSLQDPPSPATTIAVPSLRSQPRLLMLDSGLNSFQVPEVAGHILFRIKAFFIDGYRDNGDYLLAWYAAVQDADNLVVFMLSSQQARLVQRQKGKELVAEAKVQGLRWNEWMQVDISVAPHQVSSRIKPASGDWQDIGASYGEGRDFTKGRAGIWMHTTGVWISDVRLGK
jgi:hypothetical protein